MLTEYKFVAKKAPEVKKFDALPLPLTGMQPEDFYDAKTDPHTMTFRGLKRFIREQANNGIATRKYVR